MSEWKNDSQRFVCFLDIMGFKDFVARNNHKEVKDKLLNLASLINEFNGNNSRPKDKGSVSFNSDIKAVLFSDSILIYTKSGGSADLNLLFYSLFQIMDRCYYKNIPLKGAISYGYFTADGDNSLYFGQPLIDAYLLQEELFYYGIIINNQVEKKIDDFKDLVKKDFVVELPTYLKSGEIKHLNLNIGKLNNVNNPKNVKEFYFTVSGRPRKYVDNTLKMIEKMTNNK